MPIDGFSFRPLIKNLNDKLINGRIDRISQPNKSTILFAIRQPGKNYFMQISIANPNNAVFLIDHQLESPPEPPIFCMVLRKQLESGKIAAIHQYNRDRLVFIDVDTIGTAGMISTKTLVCEFMGKYSNVILVEDGIILDALKKIGAHQSRVRIILPGHKYEVPPSIDKIDLDDEDALASVAERFAEKKFDTLKDFLINTVAGFGSPSVNQVCKFGNLDPLSKLFDADLPKILTALTEYQDFIESMSIDELFEWSRFFYVPPKLPDRDLFEKIIHREINRAKSKIVKLQKDFDNTENADIWKIKADNLLTYQHQFKDRVDKSVTVPNIYDDTELEIFLDQRLTIAENVQAFYKKYDKLKRGRNFIAEQMNECRDEINYLESIEDALSRSDSLSDLSDIRKELSAGGYIEKQKLTAQKKSTPIKLSTDDGMEILVGRNNLQNDHLSFKLASPNDLWLHTKDIPGSHVILRCGNAELTDDNILFAARIAAKFSKASESSNVPVDYTRVKFLKKPNGSKPGFVIFTHQKTILVNPYKEELI